ncbi:Ankyrin repeat and KH domain-containing protein mask [Colletotrichum siamense]|nr:Ankyrin repeat and KH domain-containing protein mask [Colletotrichum siamense]
MVAETLQTAALAGKGEIVGKLIDLGVDLNFSQGFHGSALQYACSSGHEHIVRMLISHGANVNSEGGEHGSPLQCACALGHREIVEILIDKGADVIAEGGRYGGPFYAACFGGDEHIIKIIIDSGFDDSIPVKNYDKLLGEACRQDIPHVVDVLIACEVDLAQDRNIGEYLWTACYFGSKEVIKALVAAGANVNARGGPRGNTLLATLTCAGIERDIPMLLIDLGAKFDTDNEFGSALHKATSEGNAPLVERLLELEADVETLGSRSTQLANALLAASWRHYGESCDDVVRVLLKNGAQGSAVDAYGRTPLMVASSSGHADTVAQLLQISGTLPNHKDTVYGWTALSLAAYRGHEI